MSERGRESSSVLGDEERPAPAAPPASTEIAPAGQETKAAEPGAMRPMSFGFGSNEILGLITHDPLADGALPS